jgi:Nucleotide modification associated domain 2
MSKIYIYVVERDFGFAPNPFHGYCTLATCKPRIRNTARVNDWVIGMGGCRLKATGRCIFAMCVTEVITFNEYWSRPEFIDKKPVINGSRKMMVGDNIYHKTSDNIWHQALSHHSSEDGSIGLVNLKRDTSSEQVIISRCFYYFGKDAPIVPTNILNSIGYKNQRGHRTFDDKKAAPIVDWLKERNESFNQVVADPFDFSKSEKRYSGSGNKLY